MTTRAGLDAMEPLTDPTGPKGCPVTECLKVIGGKWKPVILYSVGHGATRFGILRRVIPGISKQVLTRQLRELEADGLIARKVIPGNVAHVEYSITPLGHSLDPVVEAMKDWGRARRESRAEQV